MIYQTLTPAPPLSASVESIWIYSGYRPPHFLERVLPSGTVEMIVQLEDSPFRCYDPESFALTPKAYSRIRRFQRALGIIHDRRLSSRADLAFHCGWYDQAHMIRDFKQFSGLTPGEYAALNGEFMLHVLIAERGRICPIPDDCLAAGSMR